MERRILIVDDDFDLANVTKDLLTSYSYQVDIVLDEEQAYERIEKTTYHLIILDINLPHGNGFEVCEELRKVSKVPVIFASARVSEDDKIRGLDIGGDDYLEKPFSLRELLARVNALVRRTYGDSEDTPIYEFGTVRVDIGNRKVFRDNREIKLALKEFDVLAYLCQNKDKILKKEQILADVWGTYSDAEISTVAVHIRWLREKLEEDPSNPQHIQTVWGIGYTLK